MIPNTSHLTTNMATCESGNMNIMLRLQLFIVLLSSTFGGYIITHTPAHTQFRTDGGSIDLSEVPKVVLSSFGFDTNNDLKWKGLSQGNLFKRPKAHTVISVEGIEDLTLANKAHYSLNNDIATVNTEPVRLMLQSHVERGSVLLDFNQYTRIYDIKSRFPGVFSDIPSSFSGLKVIFSQGSSGITVHDMASLNITNEADLTFLAEIYMLKQIVNSLKSHPEIAKDSQPDFYHLKVSGLRDLMETHGKQAQQVKDAVLLLQTTIAQVTSDLRELYKDNVVVTVVTYINDDTVLTRKGRSLMANPTVSPLPATSVQDELNIARLYKENYGVMFNLILWFIVAMVVTIYFVTLGIWFMDPGRDSIIYRMTSQRLKRE